MIRDAPADHGGPAERDASLRAVFAGRRGRLLAGLLLAEVAAAVQTVAYSTVLPLASRELGGAELYGATLAVGSLTTILVLAAGPAVLTRLGARPTLFVATALYVAGVLAAATATAMVWVLLGSALRGVAGGLLAGFGLTAIGGMYSDAVRARVLGLFAVAWLLPSLLGPALNAVVATTFGWRWAMAWPALVVLAARLLVGRDAGIIPWHRDSSRVQLGGGLVVVASLAVASAAPVTRSSAGAVLFVVGVAVATVAATRILDRTATGEQARRRTMAGLMGLCLAYFGGSGLLVLAVVEVLQRDVVVASLAFGAGLVAWSLTGLRPTGGSNAPVIGLALVTGGLALEAVVMTRVLGTGTGAVAVAVAAWALAGLGMGMAYPRLSAQSFDRLPDRRVPAVAGAVGFAEMAGGAVGQLLGGGAFSLAVSLGIAAGVSVPAAFVVLALAAAVALVGTARRPAAAGQKQRVPLVPRG